MLQNVNWDQIPDQTTVPTGTYQFAIASIEKTQSRAGNLMFDGMFEIVAPECPHVGMNVWEHYAIGNESDPDADQQQTWDASIGAKRLKAVLKASMTPLSGSLEECCMAAAGQQFVAAVVTSVQADGDYAGRSQTKIANVYPLGHSELTGPQEAEKPAAKPAPKAAPKAAPAQQQQVPKQVAPAARAVLRQAPATAPARQVQQAPARAPAAPARPVKQEAPATAFCAVCEQSIPREEFVAHVTAHQNEAA